MGPLAGARPGSPSASPSPGVSPSRSWAANRDLYDGEVAYLDRQVGRLLDFLESRGLLENTIVAVVADHGENLGEHGIRYRHVGLFDTTTHVPLMIRWPGRKGEGRRIEGLVQTIDLFPTLRGCRRPHGSEGQDGTDLRELTGGRAGQGGAPSSPSTPAGSESRCARRSSATA